MCIDIGRAPGGWDNPFSVRLSVSVDLVKCTMEVLTWGADRAETNIYLDNKFNERTGFPEKCEERKKERDSEKKKEFPEPKAIAQLNCFFSTLITNIRHNSVLSILLERICVQYQFWN